MRRTGTWTHWQKIRCIISHFSSHNIKICLYVFQCNYCIFWGYIVLWLIVTSPDSSSFYWPASFNSVTSRASAAHQTEPGGWACSGRSIAFFVEILWNATSKVWCTRALICFRRRLLLNCRPWQSLTEPTRHRQLFRQAESQAWAFPAV